MTARPPDLATETWYDGDAGPVVRPYAVTGGRVRTDHEDLDLVAVVVARTAATAPDGLGPEQVEILDLCRRPISVAEVGAYVGLPLCTARVLLCDLRDAGLVAVSPAPPGAGPTSERTLERVLAGLRTL